MNRVVRIGLFTLAAVVVACGVAFAGGSREAGTTGAVVTDTSKVEWEYMADTSPFTFDVWWVAHWGFNKPAIEAGWDDANPVYQEITKKTGGKINFQIPPGSEEELLGPMMASGNLPDVVVLGNNNSPYIKQLKEAGQLYSWTELIDKYSPKMWQVMPKSVVTFHTDADGKLYKYVSMIADEVSGKGLEAIGLPATAHYNIGFVRKDILAAFGAKDITDLDVLTQFLRFSKANYPDVDPIQIPADDPRSANYSFFRHFRSTFGAHLSDTYPAPDGTIKLFMYDPRYVDYLRWLNGLYREGIITTNMLAEDDQAKTTKYNNGGYAFLIDSMWGAYGTVNATIRANTGSDEKTYIDVGPIQKKGIKWQCDGYRNKGSMATLITKSAKRPDRIIRFFEYMLSEDGQMTTEAGPAGWVYDVVGGKYVPKKEAIAAASANLQEFTTKYRTSGPWAFIAQDYYWEYYLGQLLNPDGYIKTQTNARLKNYIRPIWDEGFVDITGGSIPVGTDLDVLYTKIQESCKEAGIKMVAAASDAQFQQLYNDCLAGIEKTGVSQVNAAFTAKYNEYCKLLGLKK